jgi:hypothetical protein
MTPLDMLSYRRLSNVAITRSSCEMARRMFFEEVSAEKKG